MLWWTISPQSCRNNFTVILNCYHSPHSTALRAARTKLILFYCVLCALHYPPLPTAVLNQLYFLVEFNYFLAICSQLSSLLTPMYEVWRSIHSPLNLTLREREKETSISKNPLKIVSYFICGCPGCISCSELYQVKGLSWQASLLSSQIQTSETYPANSNH